MTKPKRKKFVEPETASAFGYNRGVNAIGFSARPVPNHDYTVKVRIIRERDYQRLLKQAKQSRGK